MSDFAFRPDEFPTYSLWRQSHTKEWTLHKIHEPLVSTPGFPESAPPVQHSNAVPDEPYPIPDSLKDAELDFAFAVLVQFHHDTNKPWGCTIDSPFIHGDVGRVVVVTLRGMVRIASSQTLGVV